MLELRDLSVYYGPVGALHNINITVEKGELVSILGANGAGKSTTLMAISGLVPPSGGSVHFEGTRIDTLKSYEVVRMGITQSPEGRRVFGPLTVRENLLLGAFTKMDPVWIDERLCWIYAMFPRLEERSAQMAGTLSGGEQQMLAIGRALMADPKLLLLDEPSLGLAPLIVKSIFNTIKEINRSGVTVILVEQNAKAALKLADRAYVLDVGHLAMEGAASDLLNDPEVQKTYLGGADPNKKSSVRR